MIRVTISVSSDDEGEDKLVSRRFKGDFDELHNREWSEDLRDILDTHFEDDNNS